MYESVTNCSIVQRTILMMKCVQCGCDIMASIFSIAIVILCAYVLHMSRFTKNEDEVGYSRVRSVKV